MDPREYIMGLGAGATAEEREELDRLCKAHDRATAERRRGMELRRKRGRRPRVADEPATQRIDVRMTETEHGDLKRVAQENRTTMADVIREAVNAYVADCSERGPIFVRS